ncbi:MAG: GldG family protein, partial [Opitutaceae bacterium]|nr:GldG family protein [Opitutaceae bacterium]
MKKGNKILIIGLLLLALVLVNYIASSFPVKIDMTTDSSYTLSDGTKQLLAKVEEPITLQFYFSRSLKDLPINYKNYATRVEEMLKQYVTASKGLIRLRIIDPKPDTEEEETALATGIQARAVSTGEILFFGLIAIQADTEKVIPLLTPAREGFLEYDISQLIYTAQLLDKPTLGIISSLPLQSFEMTIPGQPAPRPSQMIIQEWEQVYEIVPIEPNQQSIPEDIDVLAVIHPQNLNPKLVFAIDQFVLKGNPLFLALDPSSHYFSLMGNPQASQYDAPDPRLTSDLPKLLPAWGITYNPQSIVADRILASRVQTQEGLVDHLLWLSLTEKQFNQEILPTSNLSSMLLIESGLFSLEEDSDLELIPLLQTTEESSRMAAMTVSYTPPNQLIRQFKPRGTSMTLAGLIRGNFKTAFPEGEPLDEDEEETALDKVLPHKNFLKESKTPGTILLVADTDWL